LTGAITPEFRTVLTIKQQSLDGMRKDIPSRMTSRAIYFMVLLMATRLKHPIDADADLLPAIEAASRNDDGAAAREHLAAGFPIYYSEDDTPAGAVIKEYPDGRRELVRFDREGEHHFQAAV